jgi:hypothetical protein
MWFIKPYRAMRDTIVVSLDSREDSRAGAGRGCGLDGFNLSCLCRCNFVVDQRFEESGDWAERFFLIGNLGAGCQRA